MPIDLQQLLSTFIEEGLENIQEMEDAIVTLNLKELDYEKINQIFRAMHTLKGNSRLYGYTVLVDLTHAIESFLDPIRKKNSQLLPEDLELMLKAGDCLRGILNAIQEQRPLDETQAKELASNFNKRIATPEETPKASKEISKEFIHPPEAAEKAAEQTKTGWHILYKPHPDCFQKGNDPNRLFAALKGLGVLTVKVAYKNLPDFSTFDPSLCYLEWELKLYGDISEATLQEMFLWIASKEEVSFHPLTASESASKGETVSATTFPAITSIRVGTEKIDKLMNTVEELVIIESMFKQIAKESSIKNISAFQDGLDDLDKNSKQLQETVLRIRMVPIAFSINRFPRMVGEIAKNMNKEVKLIITGEDTEIDKIMIEKISDPLLHIIRNAIDHGIEHAEARKKMGKNPIGSIKLNAYQEGNNIVIDISDDGAGLNIDKIKQSAIEKGLISKEKELSIEECYQLIFRPGFSTAEKITDISGRGVGLDVVLKNLQDLGGRVDVLSTLGQGTTFRLRLPLTLAIMDCQFFKLKKQLYCIPLSSIQEMLKLDMTQVTLNEKSEQQYNLHGNTIDIYSLAKILRQEGSEDAENKFLIVVKYNENLIGIIVDDISTQQQAVIKSIEKNYTKVTGIAGATIMGNGEIALILDTKELYEIIANNLSIPKKTISYLEQTSEQKMLEIETSDMLCFFLDEKEFCFDMFNVQEICQWRKSVALPYTPSYMEGIINLRGVIVPILDLREIFSLPSYGYGKENLIIVINIKQGKESKLVGLIVDIITGIHTIKYADIKPVPEENYLTLKNYIKGFILVKQKLISLLSPTSFIRFGG